MSKTEKENSEYKQVQGKKHDENKKMGNHLKVQFCSHFVSQ